MKRDVNILLAEDNPDDVFLLRQAFKKAAASGRLCAVANGLEVLQYLNGEGDYHQRELYPLPDILLLDLNMPGMNGFEVLQWVRQSWEWSRLLVHVLSASARPEDIQKAYDLRANSYVIKPNRMDELVAFVAALHQWHCHTALPPRPAGVEGASARAEIPCLKT